MFFYKKVVVFFLVFVSLFTFALDQKENAKVSIYPSATYGILQNPGVGIQEFQGNHLDISLYPKTSVKYSRFYWSDLEPVEGEISYDLIDKMLLSASQSDTPTSIEFRVMMLDGPESGTKIPAWLVDKGINGKWTGDEKTFVPDFSSPVLIKYARRLLMALGKRYDGNPMLTAVDIGLVGSWGEWHISNFPNMVNIDKRYSNDVLHKYVDMHLEAFPSTPLIMLINGGESLSYAVRKGAGWRADCLGDYSDFSPDWSHMGDDYPARIAAATKKSAGFAHAWKFSPVSFEICNDMQFWNEEKKYTKWQIQNTFNWALSHHASTINLKSHQIPSNYRSSVSRALSKLGYHIRLRSLTYNKVSVEHRNLFIDAEWINEGVAPSYKTYYLSFNIVNSLNEVVQRVKTSSDLKGWMPGETMTRTTISLDPKLPIGTYEIRVAFLNDKNEATINLAMEGRELLEPWYTVTTFTLTKSLDNAEKK